MPTHLRVAIFACGPLDAPLATKLNMPAGVEGTGATFYKFLIENPKAASPLDGSLTVISPEYAALAANLQHTTYDVLGGPAISADAEIFDDNDSRFPTKDALNTIDAIFVSGSGTSVRYLREPDKKAEWEGKIRKLQRYLRWVIDNKEHIKLFGICFGHQILSFASGHAVERNPKGWEVGPTDISLNDLGKDVFQKGSLTMQELHEDQVLLNTEMGGMGDSGRGGYEGSPAAGEIRPADETVIDRTIPEVQGLVKWGWSDITKNQGMIKIPAEAKQHLSTPDGHLNALEQIHIFTSQGHPELDRTMIEYYIEEYSEGKVPGGIPEIRAQAGLARNKDMTVEISTDDIAIVWWQMLKGVYDAKNAA